MYCPQCGQPQVMDSTRFCSRCGLLLSGLPEWLAAGHRGAVERRDDIKLLPSQRRKSIKRGAKLMFLSGVLFPVFLGLSVLFDSPGPLLVPVTLFLTASALMLYALLFADNTPIVDDKQTRQASVAGAPGRALPPNFGVPVNNMMGEQVKTSELVGPASVTENTTRLLNRE